MVESLQWFALLHTFKNVAFLPPASAFAANVLLELFSHLVDLAGKPPFVTHE